jgi:hypothetical protein
MLQPIDDYFFYLRARARRQAPTDGRTPRSSPRWRAAYGTSIVSTDSSREKSDFI